MVPNDKRLKHDLEAEKRKGGMMSKWEQEQMEKWLDEAKEIDKMECLSEHEIKLKALIEFQDLNQNLERFNDIIGKELPEITKQLFEIGNFLDSIQLALNDEYFRGK
jgi:hypothetical protein